MENRKIEKLVMPSTEKLSFLEEKEPFVDVEKYTKGKVVADMQYNKQGRNGAISTAYLRKTVVEKLLQAAAFLPEGYALKIFDAWRPYEVQKSLYDEYYERVKAENPTLTEEQLHEKAKTFVSFPDKTKQFAYVHSSGGAVDLTIVDEKGVELDMGTPFDDFSALSATCVLEEGAENLQARDNRRLLYNAMTKAGFTNYPSEWWHYDYGDIFWGAMTGCPVKYSSVYTKEEILEISNNGGAVEI